MKSHSFTIIASGLDFAGAADRFFEAGCSDATLAFQKGLIVAEFDREAKSFLGALASALKDVARTGAKVERIEPDYLVSANEIAKRSNCSRAAVSLYAKGQRGADFPHPIARVTTDSPLWDWVEVSAWMHRQGHVGVEEVVEARVVREINKVVIERAGATSWFGRKIVASREHSKVNGTFAAA